MTDMIVNLYNERELPDEKSINKKGIYIQRALVIDRQDICQFVKDNFQDICSGWVDECASSLYRQPPSCFIAIRAKSIIGFSCYDSTAKGMLGPIGVTEEYRNLGIARNLLSRCIEAMKMDGYAYAIIGWVSSTEFYEKICGAVALPDSFSGVYSRMIKHN